MLESWDEAEREFLAKQHKQAVQAKQTVTAPVKAEPVKAGPVKAELVKAEPVKAEPVKTVPLQPTAQ